MLDSEVLLVAPETPFEVTLERNAGTGYTWQLDISKGLQILTHQWVPSKPEIPGGQGKDKWVLLSHTSQIERTVARFVQPWRINEIGYKADRTIVYLIVPKNFQQ